MPLSQVEPSKPGQRGPEHFEGENKGVSDLQTGNRLIITEISKQFGIGISMVNLAMKATPLGEAIAAMI